MNAAFRVCLQAAADGRLYQRISQTGSFDVYEKPLPELGWTQLPPITVRVFQSALRDQCIQPTGAPDAERWVAFGLTERGRQWLKPR